MENRDRQIFSEIRDMISSMRAQLDALEAKVAQLSQEPAVEEVEDAPIEIDIEDVLDDITVAEPVEAAVGDIAAELVAEPVVELVAEPVAEPAEEVVEEIPDDDLPFDDLPSVEEPVLMAEAVQTVFEEPVEIEDDLPISEILIDAAVANAKPAVIDAMTAKEAWRTDIPGSPVKDIRSAISLHDRIIFINGLFGEDPMLFQEVLTAINSMSSVDEVLTYLSEKCPEWDMNSDAVYRFMMAVRRRIQ